MDVSVKNFQDLFHGPLRCEIPIFQRPYVWTLEDQWEHLWDDIQGTARNYLEQLDEFEGDQTKAQSETRKHFMGAVVLQQQPSPIGAPKRALVIDGQQRLTTIQLLLDAAQEVILELGLEQDAQLLEQLILNQFVEGDERYKVWPAHDDRDAFRAAMDNHASIDAYRDSRIVEAHEYFKRCVLEWATSDLEDYPKELRVTSMRVTLCGLFEVAVIDLSEQDDPFVIFETLNARGTPLAPADLVKNYILQSATPLGLADQIYDEIWKPLETDFWREEVRTGALVRSQLDTFLQYWLASVTAAEIRSERVFPEFRVYTETVSKTVGIQIREVAASLRSAADIYEGWHLENSRTRLGTFLERGWKCGLGSLTPLVLWLEVESRGHLDVDDRLQVFADIESFLVRRSLCRVMTAGLTRIGSACIGELRDVRPREWRSRLRAFLTRGEGPSRWPTDDEMADSLLRQPVYGRIGVNKIRMMLEAVEENLRALDPFGPDTGFERGKLTVEHIMPRAWRKNWPLADNTDSTEEARDMHIDTLGNLTLVNMRLNSSVSNGPWNDKRKSFGTSSTLYLTKNVVSSEHWDEGTMRTRGEDILQSVLDIWPRPLV